MIFASPFGAEAHLGHVILNAERYLKLDVSAREARLVVSLTLGAREGRRVLEAADTDDDGTVTRAEADAYLAQWGEGLTEELPVRVDGARVPARWRESFFDPIGPVRAVPVTVEQVAHVPLPGGTLSIRVDDEMVRRDVFDRTDVAFRARDGASLLASGAEPEPADVVRDLSYPGGFRAGESIPLVAQVETPARARRRSSLWVAGGGLLLLALVGLWHRFSAAR